MLASETDLAARIDHTLLAPGVTRRELNRHCREAAAHRFHAVCVLPAYLQESARCLRGSAVKLCAAVSFPHGAATPLGKVFEALECWKLGAEELDLVADLAALRDGDGRRFANELREVMAKTPECRHKVIVEVGLLTDRELYRAIQACNELRPAFLKTSTGTVGPPVTAAQIEAIRRQLHDAVEIKAAGGIRTLAQVEDLLAAGATRIGTRAAVAIVEEFRARAGRSD